LNDEKEGPYTYLVAHPLKEFYLHPFIPGSTVVDPWRYCRDVDEVKVILYGKS